MKLNRSKFGNWPRGPSSRLHPTFTVDGWMGGGAAVYTIDYALRFRAANSAYLARTFGSPTSSSIYTLSLWVKRGALTGTHRLFGASTTTFFGFNSSDQLTLSLNGSTAFTSTAVFRDPSAWYHIVYQQNGSAQTCWVNNVSVGTGSTAAAVFNTAIAHQLGAANTSNYFDGLVAAVFFVDGQALTPSSFGETNAASGQWVPKAYAGTYGTNGFYLDFADAASTTTIGYDAAGSNDWTTSGISVTSGVTFDQSTDTPTNNYATCSPLIVLSRGSLRYANSEYTSGSTATHGSCAAGFAIPTTGEWCWEVIACKNVNNEMIGVANIQNNPQLPAAGAEIGSGSRGDYGYRSDGNKYNNGSGGAYGATYTANDVIGVVWNSNSGTLTFYKNGASQGTAYSSITQVDGKFVPASSNAETTYDVFNFGQRPLVYSYGTAKALNTTNLSTPAIPDGSAQMNAVVYTGTGSSLAVTGTGHQPDLVWIKGRSGATDHALYDAVRGTQARLESNTTDDEATSDNGLTAFGADGFTVNTLAQVNTNAATYVGWCWKEGVTPGFDIVSYTGNGSNRTINHSLGAIPKFMIVKARTTAGANQGWAVYHSANTAAPETDYLLLNSTATTADLNTIWNDTAPTSSVFSVGTDALVNTNSDTYIAYLWTAIPGFSAFGTYTGDGSVDGPFVWCGFKPSFLLIKNTTFADNWLVYDAARNLNNVVSNKVAPNSSIFENHGGIGGPTINIPDFLAGGFKPRDNTVGINRSGDNYIYAAFAECPFKTATAR